MSDSEVDLLRDAVDGGRPALETLLKTYGPEVRRRLELRIPSRFRAILEASDVMQVTYLEAFLAIGRRRSESIDAFRNWLSRIAQNNLNDALRMLNAAKRGQPVTLEGGSGSVIDLPEVIAASTAGPRTKAGRNQRAALVRRALDRLPPDYRAVLELYDLDERPIEEVCERLGRREGAVYMLRSRAAERLKVVLQDFPDLISQ